MMFMFSLMEIRSWETLRMLTVKSDFSPTQHDALLRQEIRNKKKIGVFEYLHVVTMSGTREGPARLQFVILKSQITSLWLPCFVAYENRHCYLNRGAAPTCDYRLQLKTSKQGNNTKCKLLRFTRFPSSRFPLLNDLLFKNITKAVCVC